MTVEEAAVAVIATASEAIRTFIREITIDHGLDPRLCLLIAGGGASGLAIGLVARELGCRRVLIPQAAAAFSAVGGQFADLIVDFSATFATTTRHFDDAGVESVLTGLRTRIDDFYSDLSRYGGETGIERALEFSVEARYPHQVWELNLPLGSTPTASLAEGKLEEAFHELHERTYAVKEEGQFVECVTWRGRGRLIRKKPAFPRKSAHGTGVATRLAYFASVGHVETEIYRGSSLRPGDRVEGPAVIEEPDTTIVVFPESAVSVTVAGNYLMEFAA
jgi:N-methylhydantoinase A